MPCRGAGGRARMGSRTLPRSPRRSLWHGRPRGEKGRRARGGRRPANSHSSEPQSGRIAADRMLRTLRQNARVAVERASVGRARSCSRPGADGLRGESARHRAQTSGLGLRRQRALRIVTGRPPLSNPRRERPCKGHVMALWRQAARLAIREKGAFCGFSSRTLRERCLQSRRGRRDNPQVPWVSPQRIHRALRLRRRTDLASTSIAERLKKRPHPTLTRGAGRLHRPRFLDARQRRRKRGGGA
jgi:hypothetical protein